MRPDVITRECVRANIPSVPWVGTMGSLKWSPWTDHGSVPAGICWDPLHDCGWGRARLLHTYILCRKNFPSISLITEEPQGQDVKFIYSKFSFQSKRMLDGALTFLFSKEKALSFSADLFMHLGSRLFQVNLSISIQYCLDLGTRDL